MKLQISNLLDSFESISLKEMDSVKLMNRIDTKFIFRSSLLPEILQQMQTHYKVLSIGNLRYGHYETLYYDTTDLDLYHQHQRGKLNRYKVRSRKYLDSNLNYFEVKFKSNKGRTIKERIKCSAIEETISGNSAAFLAENSPLKAADLQPAVWVIYTRITMVNRRSAERVTLDIGLKVQFEGKEKLFDDMVIAEVKQGKSTKSPFIHLMKKYHYNPGSISKYCLGIIHTRVGVKMNNFKPKLQRINKAIYGKTA